jgi:hypothetical protein
MPHLALLARLLLAIPASSAASERVFSACGNLISRKRSRLSPTSVRDQIFLKSAMPKIVEHSMRKGERLPWAWY